MGENECFPVKKVSERSSPTKNFSFTKKFHFHTVLQSPLRKTKKQVGTPTNDRVDLFWAIFGLWHSNWVRIDKARMAKPYWHGWTSERAPRGATRNRRIAFVQDFSNSFVYVFFSISLKSIIAFGTFFHCLEIEMHKSAQWIKISKKVSFTQCFHKVHFHIFIALEFSKIKMKIWWDFFEIFFTTVNHSLSFFFSEKERLVELAAE